MKIAEGWLRKGTPKPLKQPKKLYFRHVDNELQCFADEMSTTPQSSLGLLDVINVFPEGKPKQGVFIVLTQHTSWRLQAVGDDADAIRDRWIAALENWLNEFRPGYKKLKKMGFTVPSVVPVDSGPESPSSRSPQSVEVQEHDDRRTSIADADLWSQRKMQNMALDFRRLELQIKLAQQSSTKEESASTAEISRRLKALEQEREEKRALAAARERELAQLEVANLEAFGAAQLDFQSLLNEIRALSTSMLKPAFDDLQAVYETLGDDGEPHLTQQQVACVLERLETMIPPVEGALDMSMSLLQKPRSDMLNRLSELEAENAALVEALEELENKKKRTLESAGLLQDLSGKIRGTTALFPKCTSASRDDVLTWFRAPQPESDSVMRAVGLTAAQVGESTWHADNENLSLMLMERVGDLGPDLVCGEDGSLKYASAGALFKLLINGEGHMKHPEFDDAILYGFPAFAQPMELFEKIALCFCTSLPSHYEGSRQRAQSIIDMNRRRLLTLIGRWLLFHESDFREKNLLKFLLDFLVTVELAGLPEEAAKLRDRVTSNIFPFMPVMPPSLLPNDLLSFELLDLNPIELARQMTRLDSALFESIETRDFLEAAWTSKNPNVATGVKAITKQFNRMSQWVASMILREEDVARRGRTIGFFIQVAEECLGLSNFNGLLQVMGALSKTEIHRLINAWAEVPKERMKLLEAQRDLLQSNCALLRQRYAQAKPPCLPYLGTYLSDLIMIGEQKTRVNNRVNYRKLQLQEKSLSALLKRTEEGVKFALREVREIRNFILDDALLYATDDLLMKRSQELEPRGEGGGTARLTRTKSKSAIARNIAKTQIMRRAPSSGTFVSSTVRSGPDARGAIGSDSPRSAPESVSVRSSVRSVGSDDGMGSTDTSPHTSPRTVLNSSGSLSGGSATPTSPRGTMYRSSEDENTFRKLRGASGMPSRVGSGIASPIMGGKRAMASSPVTVQPSVLSVASGPPPPLPTASPPVPARSPHSEGSGNIGVSLPATRPKPPPPSSRPPAPPGSRSPLPTPPSRHVTKALPVPESDEEETNSDEAMLSEHREATTM